MRTPSSAVLTVRHRPPPKGRRRFRPALGWTAFCRPVPVLGEEGRTGRLRTLDALGDSRSGRARISPSHCIRSIKGMTVPNSPPASGDPPDGGLPSTLTLPSPVPFPPIVCQTAYFGRSDAVIPLLLSYRCELYISW